MLAASNREYESAQNCSNELSANATLRGLQTISRTLELPLFCVDSSTGTVIGSQSFGSVKPLAVVPSMVQEVLAHITTQPRIVELESGLLAGLIPLELTEHGANVAVAYALKQAGHCPQELFQGSASLGWSLNELNDWLANTPHCSQSFFQRTIELSLEHQHSDTSTNNNGKINPADSQNVSTNRRNDTLVKIADQLKIPSPSTELAECCLEQLHEGIAANGSGIWIYPSEGDSQFIQRGFLPIDEVDLARIISFYDDADWSVPIVRNQLENEELGRFYPDLYSIMLTPISINQNRCGWILCLHIEPNKTFDDSDASLASSMAAIVATHTYNSILHQRNDDAVVSFVKTLVSIVDAKDEFTRGHSERVALIARRLGQELGLADSEVNDLYMAGLLHDIGKVGVDDRILRKPGELTEAETQEVQKHPVIGFSILKQFDNLKHLLPVIRGHRESMDGTGYPDHLTGEQIPLLARILAVADAFDAMGSDRPFRNGMPLERVEAILRENSGIQWDANVVNAYFRARNDIVEICKNYSLESSSLLTSTEVCTIHPHIDGFSLLDENHSMTA